MSLAIKNTVYAVGLSALFILGAHAPGTNAAPLSLANVPLFLTQGTQPLTLLAMGRDHKLYFEAYDDASDLDNDGVLDLGYKGHVLKVPADPSQGYKLNYFGYFDSFKCYSYNSGQGRFEPVRATTDKKCTVVDSEWSGDFLNYLTMSRMDILRKVLFGGYRSTDSTTQTVLERVYIPQDTHSWAKEYTSTAQDGYDIAQYSPLAQPTTGKHLFANTTLGNANPPGNPLLRVLQNRSERMWHWVAREVVQAGNTIGGQGVPAVAVTPTDYQIRVEVCKESTVAPTYAREANCKRYTSGGVDYYKPTGLLQDNADTMKFGLMTGSYTKNLSGGVLRKQIGSINDEIQATGQFSGTNGIISTINKFRVLNFISNNHNTTGHVCGLIPTRPLNEGECRIWGNPIGEIMYEGIRYFAGRSSPTTAFDYSGAGDDQTLGLPKVDTWTDPYSNNPWCAKPSMVVISDVSPSYDTDQLPGVDANFGAFAGDTAGKLSGLNVSTLGQTIWDIEQGATGISKSHFIGQVGATYNGAPTAKTVTTFGNIRGLSPDEPTKRGGYYSASVAYYAHTNDISTVSGGTGDTGQKVDFYSIALSSPLPYIDITVSGSKITLVPFAKSVAGVGINSASGQFQPTNSLARVFIESLNATSGTFRVNFEDQEQGNDYDMDAIVQYSYVVNGAGTVDITTRLVYAAGGITQHIGYIISGTTADGTYLEIQDETACASDIGYFLDTPTHANGTCLATPAANGSFTTVPSHVRTFTPSNSPPATILKDPLWFVAKFGGFKDANSDGTLSSSAEFDIKNNLTTTFTPDGIPDNYYYVTNPVGLAASLTDAFENILRQSGTAAAVAVNTSSVTTASSVYQVKFTGNDATKEWSGNVLARSIDPTTKVVNVVPTWDAGEKLKAQPWNMGAGARNIITWNPDLSGAKKGVAFRWPNIGGTNQTYLNADTYGSQRLDYLRGDSSREGATAAPTFRLREANYKLGDIVNSAPEFVGSPAITYPDALEASPHSAFRSAYASRLPMIYVGANDGMLHGFNACTSTSIPGCGTTADHGTEKFGYVPSLVYPSLSNLSSPAYAHRYYVDLSPTHGDVFGVFDAGLPPSRCGAPDSACWRTILVGGLRAGGTGYFALDITDPSQFSEGNADKMALWEFTDPDLGYTFSEATITKMQAPGGATRWAVVFGNGYNSAGEKSVLFVVDAITGQLIRKFEVAAGSNGMSSPRVVDVNGDFIADYIYAGDLQGNLWKFVVTDPDKDMWRVAYGDSTTPLPVFRARDNAGNTQSITARPAVAIQHPDNMGGYMVYVGTGRYIASTDNIANSTPVQTFYGIWDKNANDATVPVTRNDLLVQQLTSNTVGTVSVRTISNNTMIWRTTDPASGYLGWRVDMPNPSNGEMMVSNPIYADPTIATVPRVVFTTLIPQSAACTFGGSSFLTELNPRSGGPLGIVVFDLNNDGVFDNNDVQPAANVAAVDLGFGIMPEPVYLDGSPGQIDLKIATGTSGIVSSIKNNDPCPGCLGGSNIRRSWRQLR